MKEEKNKPLTDDRNRPAALTNDLAAHSLVGLQDVVQESPGAFATTQKTVENGVPSPESGDIVVFCPNVDAYTASRCEPCRIRGGRNGVRYAVLELPDGMLEFVLSRPESSETVEICLKERHPGFDTIAFWSGIDTSLREWILCVYYQTSGRVPVPEALRHLIRQSDMEGCIFELEIHAYQKSGLATLRDWRRSHNNPSPDRIMRWCSRIGELLRYALSNGHGLIRVSPDNMVVDDDDILLLGFPPDNPAWDERCAGRHDQSLYAPIPPECHGFARHHLTGRESVYLLGAFAYFLVAGTQIPTCEILAYEAAVPARTFRPSFPIGWEEIVARAISPDPESRPHSIGAFLNQLSMALDDMIARRDHRQPVTFDAAVDTHIGVTKRTRCPINQDAVFIRTSDDGQRMLLVVADGVSTSTYGTGDIASGIVIRTAQQAWEDSIRNASTLNPSEQISNILIQANRDICQYIDERFADKSPQPSECMGTTALVAIIENGVLTLASAGDSRAYVVRSDMMECVTRDHNLFTVGIINHVPVEFCAIHPHAGSLVQCLGYCDGEDDCPGFDIFSLRLIPGDTLIMTTDGILDYIACEISESERKIADIVRSGNDAKSICEELIIQANLGGGGDNCGIALVRVSAAEG